MCQPQVDHVAAHRGATTHGGSAQAGESGGPDRDGPKANPRSPPSGVVRRHQQGGRRKGAIPEDAQRNAAGGEVRITADNHAGHVVWDGRPSTLCKPRPSIWPPPCCWTIFLPQGWCSVLRRRVSIGDTTPRRGPQHAAVSLPPIDAFSSPLPLLVSCTHSLASPTLLFLLPILCRLSPLPPPPPPPHTNDSQLCKCTPRDCCLHELLTLLLPHHIGCFLHL
ncbi:hypothetical protein PTSG_13257 [Salpingoeca rosetta]|uniref:Uncharacterized protein n=1 Tax=Salpingoeca rosetta (strain ATCC 50818 / BSB-021) TaxID=946362 RepID=F2UHN5_SALR5|nr:uncharacterized protein PTSG_13257 [Salpingoeca rosetta]EGD76634.1 hypothetical protein PTSG_13257 [Salpingoeca rosetta]|eukprot:XP_004991548.1 hypothetical protein PTSG_13257 [Salpingoeca rosetta]